MRSTPQFVTSLAATLLGAVLAGCSSSAGSVLAPSQPTSSSAPGNADVKVAKGDRAAEFISDANNHEVDIISHQGAVSTLHVYGPEGVAVDASHNLYVVDAAGDDVQIYAPPYNGKPKTLSGAGVMPYGIAIDRNGNVAVTSLGSPSVGPGGIAFYAKGATSPTNKIIANGTFAGDYYCAFDADGNLYLDSQNGSGPFEAGEVAGGINGTSVTPLTTTNLVRYPSGIQFTKAGKIAILDQGTGSVAATIYTYDPPINGSFGAPVKTTLLSNANNAIAFAFDDQSDHVVLTADTFYTVNKAMTVRPNHEDQIGQTQRFNYPAGGSPTQSIRLAYDAELVGVAINPSGK